MKYDIFISYRRVGGDFLYRGFGRRRARQPGRRIFGGGRARSGIGRRERRAGNAPLPRGARGFSGDGRT